MVSERCSGKDGTATGRYEDPGDLIDLYRRLEGHDRFRELVGGVAGAPPLDPDAPIDLDRLNPVESLQEEEAPGT